jgi:hypothetical protein
MNKRINLFACIFLFYSLAILHETKAQQPTNPPKAQPTAPLKTSPKTQQNSAQKTLLTCNTLLEELTDRSRLAEYQGGQWSLHHASSYDRHSVAKDQEGWYANDDWDNYIRKENINGREEYVLLDTDGPGVITRFWVAGHPNKKAHLRFYVDGQKQPFWDADHTGALIGHNTAIDVPLSQRSVEQDSLHINEGAQPGHNLYAPIPFAHHLKVTYDKPPGGADNGFWYNIDYRIYQPGTPVESFSAGSTARYAAAFRKTNQTLQGFMDKPLLTAVVPGEKEKKDLSFSLDPGSAKTLELENAGSIRKVLLSLEGSNLRGDLDDAVKDLWLQIDFDGMTDVDAPVGFFFGSGDQLLTAKDWYSKSDTLGNMAAYWVMPYRRSAVVRLVNKGNDKITGSLHVSTGNWKWDKRSQYFHADFKRMDHFMTQKQTGKDYTYLELHDKTGTYAGDRLQVYKPVGGWWGEGDEKIYIDGSTFPDDFGTGSEDYYGYAWGHPETFTHIFNAQPLGDANLGDRGGTTVNSRLRDMDAIPFHHDFRFDMESWNWHGGAVNFDWICFWYEQPQAQ